MTTWRTTTKRNDCGDGRAADAHAVDDAQSAIEKLRRPIATPNRHLADPILSRIRKLVTPQRGSKPSACWWIRTSNADPPAAVTAVAETETREILDAVAAANLIRQTPFGNLLFRIG